MYLGYGVLGGIGIGLTYNTSRSILAKYFNKYRKFACGLTSCGTGVGSFILPPIIKALDDTYSWRGTVLLIAGILAHCIFFCSIFKPVPKESGDLDRCKEQQSCEDKSDNEKRDSFRHIGGSESNSAEKIQDSATEVVAQAEADIPDVLPTTLSLFRRIPYVCICLHAFFYQFNYGILYTHLGSYMLSLGFSHDNVILLYMIMGISSTLSRVIIGILTEVLPINSFLLVTICALLNGTLTIFVPFTNHLSMMFVYGAFLSILLTPASNLELPMITESVPSLQVPSAFGVTSFFRMPGNVFGAPLAGKIFMYDIAMIIINF